MEQGPIERILADWVDELGVPVLRGREVTGLGQSDDGVRVETAGGAPLRAAYVVGCDGGRSVVRRAVGVDFPGTPATTSWIIAEVAMTQEPVLGMRPEGGGIGPVPGGDGRRYSVVLIEPEVHHAADATPADLRTALVASYGSDFGARSPTWISRFTDATRQATSYRSGRVLLAGDAAHVHPPQGGQGLGIGLQDAVNLGWKLAQVVDGTSPAGLLDSYHDERHPVGARVLRTVLAQVTLSGAGERERAARETVAELLALDAPRRHMAAAMCGLDVRYDLGDGHPVVGRRMPDLDIRTADGSTRVFTLLHEARPVLLVRPGAGPVERRRADVDRLRIVGADYDGVWELPVLGDVQAPAAVLVRPDGHVAWAGELGDRRLDDALATWCGVSSGRDYDGEAQERDD